MEGRELGAVLIILLSIRAARDGRPKIKQWACVSVLTRIIGRDAKCREKFADKVEICGLFSVEWFGILIIRFADKNRGAAGKQGSEGRRARLWTANIPYYSMSINMVPVRNRTSPHAYTGKDESQPADTGKSGLPSWLVECWLASNEKPENDERNWN
jgi:hypothetical protein